MKPYLVCLLLTFLTLSVAQDLRVGLVLSQTGQAAAQGDTQTQTVNSLRRAWQNDPLGRRIELLVKDDGSSPVAAAEQARQLIEEGVHALVCCTTTEATRTVADVGAAAGVVVMSPSTLDAASGWLFSTRPDTQRLLQLALLRLAAGNNTSVALMTLDNAYGEDALAALESLTVEDGVELVEVTRYPPNAAVLTPEALWVATRQPAAVIVWGLPRDSRLAYEGLRARGFERPVLLNPQLLAGAEFDTPGLDTLENALFPLNPLQLSADLTEAHPSFAAVVRYQATTGSAADPYLYDALYILRGALEQALVYGLSPDNLSAFRSATRDALVTGGRTPGVTAVFNYSEVDPLGIDPYSLLLGQVKNGELRVYR